MLAAHFDSDGKNGLCRYYFRLCHFRFQHLKGQSRTLSPQFRFFFLKIYFGEARCNPNRELFMTVFSVFCTF